MKKLLLPEQIVLLSLFTYLDGKLYCKTKTKYSHHNIGDEVGHIDTKTKYHRVTVNKQRYFIHNVIWKMLTGNDPVGEIDHINHNKSDNRIENLRDVSKNENAKNKSKMKNNTSGEPNIFIRKNTAKKYRVVFSGEKYEKTFYTLEEAIQHRNEKYIEFGFHENHGSTSS